MNNVFMNTSFYEYTGLTFHPEKVVLYGAVETTCCLPRKWYLPGNMWGKVHNLYCQCPFRICLIFV